MAKNLFERSWQTIKDSLTRAAERAERLRELQHAADRESLTDLVNRKLKGRQLILASHREPYVHILSDGKVSWYRYAGGLTIALDSMAAACQAVWVCCGSGETDFAVADAKGLVAVPPNRPAYQLRRLLLTPDEEKGYYEGFANETLWPLCHVCYIRPRFAPETWQTYQAVNRKFADAILDMATPGSIVFLQDYHLCLVPKYLKEARPDLTTIMFWHIPWPNPEIFRICPWKREILEGLLANDILGFHVQYHAANFMETVGLELEARLDWEKTQIIRNESQTKIRAYPISIDFQSIYQQADARTTTQACQQLGASLGLEGKKVLLGVDRLDYTKGIPERLDALDRLLENYPEYRGAIVMIQIGVPSRANLEDYQQVVQKIESRCDEINAKYGQAGWKPVIFQKGHHDFDTLIPFYKLADVCIVSSLHDGMNLVAKEFVAASSNDRGVLLLSRFTGASRELEQALLINPYDLENFTAALHQALQMPVEEQKQRLGRMRQTVAEQNVYQWAQLLFQDVVKLAEDTAVTAKA
ncbi:MAG: trehalose-6-phosphate synthase [candidate division FCPU426 bacterium]